MIQAVYFTSEIMAKQKQKKPKAVKPHQLKNVQVVDRPVSEKFIAPIDLIYAKSLPQIIDHYTLETLADKINIYFADEVNQPFNLASLQCHLGINDVVQWDNLMGEDIKRELKPLVYLLRKATKYIESELVMLLLSRSQVAGIIFYLKAKFSYIEREILETISTQAIDIRFTIETEDEKIQRQIREKAELHPLLTE